MGKKLNFWKYLPVGNLINYTNKFNKGLVKDTHFNKMFFHSIYTALSIAALGSYSLIGFTTHTWTLKQWKEYHEKVRIEQEMEKAQLDEVNYEYSKIFENATNFQDTVDIYQKYGLPIILLNPSLEKKEKAIKQNELEKSFQ